MSLLNPKFFALPIAAVLIIAALPRVPAASTPPEPAGTTKIVLKASPLKTSLVQPQNSGAEIRFASVAVSAH